LINIIIKIINPKELHRRLRTILLIHDLTTKDLVCYLNLLGLKIQPHPLLSRRLIRISLRQMHCRWILAAFRWSLWEGQWLNPHIFWGYFILSRVLCLSVKDNSTQDKDCC